MNHLNHGITAEATPAHGVEQLVSRYDESLGEEEKTVLLPAASGGRSTLWLEIPASGQRFDIACFPVSLGRHNDCDIVLDGDGISRRHASLLKVDGGYAIEDCGSLNGIRINGYAVDHVLLGDGDRISIGTAELVFRQELAAKPPKPQAARVRKRVLALVAFGAAVFVSAGYAHRVGYLTDWNQWLNHRLLGASPVANSAPMQDQPSRNGEEPAATAEAALPTTVVATLADSNIAIPTSAQGEAQEAVSADGNGVSEAPADAIAEGGLQRAVEAEIASAAAAAPADAASAPPRLATEAVADVGAKAVSQKEGKIPVSTSLLIVNDSDPPAGTSVVASAAARIGLGAERSKAMIDQARADYLDGNAEAAFASLGEMAVSKRHRAAERQQAKQLLEALEQSHRHYLAGEAAYASERRDEAFAAWQRFLESENALLLARRSAYARRVDDSVFGEYLAIAEQARREGDHHTAYRYWQRAAAIRPDSEAAVALASLEGEARNLYREGYRKETVNLSQARDHWQRVLSMVPPGSEYHTKARAKLRWYAYLDQ